MKKLIAGLFIASLTMSCGNTGEEAKARLAKAQSMYENNELFAAKNEIDSIRTLYPKEFDVLKQTLSLMRLVEIKENERTIAYCDSLLPIKTAELIAINKDFVFEKDSLYEEVGNYIWKQQTIEKNISRCYIRSGVNEKRERYLARV